MTAHVINSDYSLQKFIGDMRELYKLHKFLRISSVKTGKDRSLDQNALSHTWYEQISRELREDTVLGVKCHCKLYYGVPILRAEDSEFRAKYDALIRDRFTTEEKLKLMEWFPVTSLMTTAQLSQYLEAMQEAYRGRVALEFPMKEAA